MAFIKNGIITSFSNTPQAQDDAIFWTEDGLLLSSFYDDSTNILSLDVMSNDLGGGAKILYSVDDGYFLDDLLIADVLTDGVSVWEASAGGDTIRIAAGFVEIDISHSLYLLTGSTDLNALAADDLIEDTFTYAIRMADGALSWARETLNKAGVRDGLTADA